jgi:hypothetical protein
MVIVPWFEGFPHFFKGVDELGIASEKGLDPQHKRR